MSIFFRKIKTLISIVRNFLFIAKHFGIHHAFHVVVMQFVKGTQYKHDYILKYLKLHYSDIIEKYKKCSQDMDSVPSSIIWVCWFQGEEAMPKTVRCCYESIKKHSNGALVELITGDNYFKFVNVSQYIIDKVNEGHISLTHFSDILRSHLLADYGGVWIDATLLLTSKMQLPHLPFFSLKFRNSYNDKSFVSNYRWVAGFMAGAKGNVLHSFMKDLLNEYHRKETMLIDYFLVDYIIALAHNNIDAVKKMIDEVPFTNEDFYYMSSNLFKPLDMNTLETAMKRTFVYRIGYKGFPDEINNNSLYLYLFNK